MNYSSSIQVPAVSPDGFLMDLPSTDLRKHSLDDSNEQTRSQDSDLETVYDQESVISDGESANSVGNSNQFSELDDGLIRLFEGDRVNDLIKRKFLSGLGSLGKQATVVAIHRRRYSGVVGQARMQSFQIFTKAMERKCGGNANVKYAWFGASRDEICYIMNNGFGRQINDNNGLYGCGIYLSPDDSPLESAKNLKVDKDGLRHLLLCRVILGKSEEVHPGSEQWHPSSEEFDSGIDTLLSPKKYIIWSTHMNTHIFPEFVISFKAPCCLKGLFKVRETPGVPTSPWMPFPALISALSKFLPSATVYVEAYTCPCIRRHPFDPCFVAQSNGNYIAIFSSSPPFRLDRYKRYEGHSVSGFPIKCNFSLDGEKLVSGSSDGFIYFYNYRSSGLIKKMKAYEHACMDVAFHPVMPNVIASCSWNGKVSVFE